MISKKESLFRWVEKYSLESDDNHRPEKRICKIVFQFDNMRNHFAAYILIFWGKIWPNTKILQYNISTSAGTRVSVRSLQGWTCRCLEILLHIFLNVDRQKHTNNSNVELKWTHHFQVWDADSFSKVPAN